MLVSICVPIYNVENYIERCAVSLFEQTYSNIEYIFVNDCSMDKSIDILLKIINNYPQRKHNIRIISHDHNRGLAAARNTAIKEAHGDFILHVDSDDWIEPHTIDVLVNEQNKQDSDIVVFASIHHFPDHNEYRKNRIINNPETLAVEILKRKATVYIWNKFLRKSLYTDNNIHTIEGVDMTEDFTVTPRLVFAAKKIATINDALYHYNRQNEKSYSFSMTNEKLDAIWFTLNLNEECFHDKGCVYKDAINKGKIDMFIRQIHIVCSQNNKSYFLKLRKMYPNLDQKLFSQYGYLARFLLVNKIYFFSAFAIKIIPYLNRMRHFFHI